MKRSMPFGVMFIGWFQIFSCIVLLLTLNVPQDPAFNVRFGVPFIPEILVRVIVGVVEMVIAYGYLRGFKWGYYTMLIESIGFSLISIKQISVYGGETFALNAIYAALVAIYTFRNRRTFLE